MQRTTSGLLLLVLAFAVGCGAPRDSASPSAAAADPVRLLFRYKCEMGPVMEPQDRSCYGPTLSLYSDGTVIYRDATEPAVEQNDVRIYPAYRVVRLTPAGVDRLIQSVRGPIITVAADPGTPPEPNEPIGDPIYWNDFDLADGAVTIELRPGRGELPRHGASTVALDGLAQRFGSWSPAVADQASAITPYRAERGCVFVQRVDQQARRPWPWPDLDAADLDLAANADARVYSPIDNAHLMGLIGDRGAWRGIVVEAPDRNGAVWLDVRALMPDESCPPIRD